MENHIHPVVKNKGVNRSHMCLTYTAFTHLIREGGERGKQNALNESSTDEIAMSNPLLKEHH